MTVDVAIVGASGYAGGELLRLLARHPGARVRCAVSETYVGQPLQASFPGFAPDSGLRFTSYGDGEEVAQCDVVFLAQENGKAMENAPHLLEAGCRVVDLSADFRFRCPAVYEQWYAKPHASPDLARAAAYGLTELNRASVAEARLVGNPGCYPTAACLALAPLLKERLVDPQTLIVDAISGVSGAGRSKFGPDTMFSEVNESLSAYKIAGTHRHTPEIEQQLAVAGGLDALAVTFTPHLAPITRGILATCYAQLKQPLTSPELTEIYHLAYEHDPFVTITGSLPVTKQAFGSNFCYIGAAVDSRTGRATIVSAIDNLVKGAAGQAVQNMNIMCGLPETEGLEAGGVWP